MQCIVDCPDADAACPDACVETGTADGQLKILAFATCVDDNVCTDATCAEDNCSVSIDACVESSQPPPPEPLVGGGLPGSVPQDLVGTWSGTVNGNAGELILRADGTGSWTFTVTWQVYACFAFKTTTMSGNVVVSEAPPRPDGGRSLPAEYGTITLYATSVVESTRECTPGTTDVIKPAATVAILWNRDEVRPYHEVADPNLIQVLDSECVASYTAGGKDPGSALGMYCTYQLTRK